MNYVTEIPMDIIHLDEGGYHIFLEGSIEESPVRWLLDTGASKTVLGNHFAITHLNASNFEENPKGATGISGSELKSQIATVSKLHIGQFHLEDLKCSIMPLEHVNHTYAKLSLAPIDAIIGMDILLKGEARILLDTGILEMKMNQQPQPNYYTGPISQ